jgi:hypothetical protein
MEVVLAVLLGAVPVGLAGYWITFYRGGEVHVVEDEGYLAFQRAFPVADGWLAVCAAIAAAGLLLDEPFGLVFMLLAASAGIFLGLMDVTYNTQHGLYRLARTSGAMRVEVLINVTILGFSGLLIVYAFERLV